MHTAPLLSRSESARLTFPTLDTHGCYEKIDKKSQVAGAWKAKWADQPRNDILPCTSMAVAAMRATAPPWYAQEFSWNCTMLPAVATMLALLFAKRPPPDEDEVASAVFLVNVTFPDKDIADAVI